MTTDRSDDAYWLQCWSHDEMARGNVSNAQRFLEIAAALSAQDARIPREPDEGCICHGNWRAIVKEIQYLIGRTFRHDGDDWILFGLVHGADDYYYGMTREGQMRLLSCVGSIKSHGYYLISIRVDPWRVEWSDGGNEGGRFVAGSVDQPAAMPQCRVYAELTCLGNCALRCQLWDQGIMNRESDQPAAVGQDNNDAGASADIPASGTRKQEPDKPPVSPQPADARDAEIRQLVALLHDLKPEWDAMTRGRIWTADRAGYKASLRQRFDAALAANPQEGK